MSGAPFSSLADGRQARLLTLAAEGLVASVTDHGARLVSFGPPGEPSLVLGLPDAAAYEADSGYLGATIGRTTNRIAGGVVVLNGERVSLTTNDGPNTLHGGASGFDDRIWTVEEATEQRVVLTLVSPDGDQGYPGRVRARLAYALSARELTISYEATTTRPTPLDMTCHAYWNLSGRAERPEGGTVLDHEVAVPASRWTPSDEALILTGSVEPTEGTPLDMRRPGRVGDVVAGLAPRPLDCNMIVDGEGVREHARIAHAGRTLTILSDAPCCQVYAGDKLEAPYKPFQGIAIEPQAWPDALAHDAFPNSLLRPGETYRRTIAYRLD